METATSAGEDSLFLSSSKSVRAAKIKIRFADIIVKSKYRKLIEESDNKPEAMMKIKREKQSLEKKQRQEKARIEARTMARGLNLRQQGKLAVKKMEEEARSNRKFENPLSDAKELIDLCGGSHQARSRRLLKQFGLILTTHDDDLEEGEIV